MTNQYSTKFEDNIEVRQAFEVEQLTTRLNFTYVWEPENKTLLKYHTNYGMKRVLLEEDNSEGAWEKFKKCYEKATKDRVEIFLGWVHPDTNQPVEDLYNEEYDEWYDEWDV